jgi:hypothetical protein
MRKLLKRWYVWLGLVLLLGLAGGVALIYANPGRITTLWLSHNGPPTIVVNSRPFVLPEDCMVYVLGPELKLQRSMSVRAGASGTQRRPRSTSVLSGGESGQGIGVNMPDLR